MLVKKIAKSKTVYGKDATVSFYPNTVQPRIGFGQERWKYRDPACLIQEVVVDDIHIASISAEEYPFSDSGHDKLRMFKTALCPFWIWNIDALHGKKWSTLRKARSFIVAAVGNAIIRGDDKSPEVESKGLRRKDEYNAFKEELRKHDDAIKEIKEKVRERKYATKKF